MKKLKFIIINILILTVIFSNPIFSQVKKVAQTGLQFLQIDAGARSSSMAGAMTIAGYDANAMFYNPAGIAKMPSNFDFMANSTQWFADIKYNSAALAYSLGDLGTVGVSAVIADYGDIVGTRVASNEQGYETTGNVDVSAYSVGLSYAKNLSDKFAVGGTVKLVGQHLGASLMPDGNLKDNKISGYAFDFGTIFYPGWKSFRFGMTIRNFSREFTYERESFELPLTFTFGVAMNVFDLLDIKDQSLLIAVDAVHPRDFSERINLGAEYNVFNMIAIRAGYKTNNDVEGLTLGVGLYYNLSGINVKVDYSFSKMNYFDNVNRFTVGFAF
jgi:hypothetical protein